MLVKRFRFLFELSPKDLKRAFFVMALAACLTAALNPYLGLYLDIQSVTSTGYRLYLRQPVSSELRTGDLVAFTAQDMVFFGRERGATVAKYIAASAGDRIVISDEIVTVNGIERARINPDIYTTFDKPQHAFDSDYQLLADEYFVLGISPRSFDSRYWGPIKRSWITARLIGII